MRTAVEMALETFFFENNRGIQFKEEWTYDLSARCPWLPRESTYKVILRGATRFEAAHAIIEEADGSRWVQSLGPLSRKGISDEQLQHRTYNVAIGKPKLCPKY